MSRTLNGTPQYDVGPPMTLSPFTAGTSVSALPANRAYYARTVNGGTISGLQVDIGVSSGNACVGVYRSSGTGIAARPGTRIATSGSVPCPAVGVQTIALTASVAVLPGDWLALVFDNGTATVRRILNAATNSAALAGQQDAAFPLPATAAAVGSGNVVMLVGS